MRGSCRSLAEISVSSVAVHERISGSPKSLVPTDGACTITGEARYRSGGCGREER